MWRREKQGTRLAGELQGARQEKGRGETKEERRKKRKKKEKKRGMGQPVPQTTAKRGCKNDCLKEKQREKERATGGYREGQRQCKAWKEGSRTEEETKGSEEFICRWRAEPDASPCRPFVCGEKCGVSKTATYTPPSRVDTIQQQTEEK